MDHHHHHQLYGMDPISPFWLSNLVQPALPLFSKSLHLVDRIIKPVFVLFSLSHDLYLTRYKGNYVLLPV